MDEDGWTPLHFAASSGHGSIVVELINADIDSIDAADNSGRKPLHLAAGGGHKNVHEAPAKPGCQISGAETTVAGMHSILQPAMDSRLTVIELIQQDLDVNCPDLLESTPLHKAAIGGHISSARELVARNANVNATDVNGNSPLHESAFHGTKRDGGISY